MDTITSKENTMSLGYYRLIRGKLIVRQHQSPDGDSMRFVADDMTLFEDLPRFAPAAETGGQASYQLRFQAIDTPELHYGRARQPYARESRDVLLSWLGVNPDSWNWDVAPAGFQWETPAQILCDGFEGHGRPIAFVFRDLDGRDGKDLKLTRKLLARSYNYHAVHAGAAYLGLYSGSLSFDTQSALIAAYKNARAARRGIWSLDRTRRFMVETLDDLGPEHGVLIYPKIFRRCVDAIRWAGGELQPGHDLDNFLSAKPDENDQFTVHCIHAGKLKSRLSDALEQINNQIRINIDLNIVEFISK